MEVTRESVMEWLSNHHHSQTWLAKQCGVTKQAASNWLRDKNPQAISAAAELKIRALMAEDAIKSQAKPPHNLVLEFSDADYGLIEQAALKGNTTVREWARETLNEAADLEASKFVQWVADQASTRYPAKKSARGDKSK
jgi:hypothetical protein